MFRAAHSRTHLFQIVFSKGNVSRKNYPMSRAFLYKDDLERLAQRVETPAREAAAVHWERSA
jgi:hypothetical protein